MDMAVAVDPNISDQDVFLDALDPDEMQDLWKLSEKGIYNIKVTCTISVDFLNNLSHV